MNLALGADHRGVSAVKDLERLLVDEGHTVLLYGSGDGEPCDYPEPAFKVCRAVASGEAERGVLVCGTGLGMCMAANKMPGIRAALVHDELTAEMARSHNDANVICLSSDLLGQPLIEKIVQIWMRTPFAGGRHERRLRKIAAIEAGQDPAGVE